MDMKPTPHEGQKEVLESDAETRVVVKGRRWGGSTLIALDLVDALVEDEVLMNVEVITATYRQSQSVHGYLEKMIGDLETVDISDREMVFSNGSRIRFRSAPALARNPPKASPQFIAIDGADGIRTEAYEEMDAEGYISNADQRLFVTTPIGYATATDEYPGSWLWEHFTDGFKVGTGTESWKFPTRETPFVPDEDVDVAESELPEEKHEQDYGARWQKEGE